MTQDSSMLANHSRRQWLKLSAAGGAGLALGATGGVLLKPSAILPSDVAVNHEQTVPFYGPYQAGIVTPQQQHGYLLSFNVLTSKRDELITLLKAWTRLADLKTSGGRVADTPNKMLPPNDSGDADDLSTSHLTVTFGFGPTLFRQNGIDRYGIAAKLPKHLNPIPVMPYDKLNPDFCGGDLCVQVCADDQQVAFHVVRNLVRLAAGVASPHWLEQGFLTAPAGQTGRNLFGFKDGTANAEHVTSAAQQAVIWASTDEPQWMQGGSYLGYRKVQMFLEVWDRSSMQDHEDTFGRNKVTGASYGQNQEHAEAKPKEMPDTAHVRLAKETGQRMHRRAFSYSGGILPRTGAVEAGLLFICFTQDPSTQLLPMLKVMGLKDKLNEYTVPIGSALFACPSGVKPGEYIGQALFEA